MSCQIVDDIKEIETDSSEKSVDRNIQVPPHSSNDISIKKCQERGDCYLNGVKPGLLGLRRGQGIPCRAGYDVRL